MTRSERHPRRWLILVVLCLSTLVLVIDNMVLTVAVPPIVDDLVPAHRTSSGSSSRMSWSSPACC